MTDLTGKTIAELREGLEQGHVFERGADENTVVRTGTLGERPPVYEPDQTVGSPQVSDGQLQARPMVTPRGDVSSDFQHGAVDVEGDDPHAGEPIQ